MPETKKPSRAREPEDLQAHIDKALAMRDEVGSSRIYKVAKFLFDPQVLHIDRIDPDRPSLFVANHGPYGIEGGLIPSLVHEHTGMFPRLLADSAMMNGPLGDAVMKLGLVLANRKVCAALMDAGESLLVYPGGAREGLKNRGEQYKLLWDARTGFVRLAIENGFTITPVGSVGPDEIWDYSKTRSELKDTWVAPVMKRLAPDDYDPELLPQIPKGLFGTIIPRPERFYIAFGKPFDTRRYAGKENDQRTLNRIKNSVQKELEGLIAEALVTRARRRHEMHWLRRRLARY